jgi:hypothetical protein
VGGSPGTHDELSHIILSADHENLVQAGAFASTPVQRRAQGQASGRGQDEGHRDDAEHVWSHLGQFQREADQPDHHRDRHQSPEQPAELLSSLPQH